MFRFPLANRAVLPCLAGLIAFGACASAADAAEPAIPKNMKIVVPFAAGASTDILARTLASALQTRLGTTVIVDNKPGAGSIIGTTAVAKAPPDGSNLLMATNSFAITAALQPQLPYDSVADFAPVAMVMTVPLVLVVSSTTPYKSVAELIAAARAQPGALNYASAGIGTSSHMAGELFNTAAKTKIVHVAYKGVANAITDLVTGRVQMMLSTYPSLSAQLQSGKLRALAVTSAAPSPFSPELPSLSATLPGYVFDGWFGLVTTAGTPPATVEMLNREIRAIAASEPMVKFMQQERAEPSQTGAAQFAAKINREVDQWKRIAAEQNIKLE